jgi:hypothetical protein
MLLGAAHHAARFGSRRRLARRQALQRFSVARAGTFVEVATWRLCREYGETAVQFGGRRSSSGAINRGAAFGRPIDFWRNHRELEAPAGVEPAPTV